MGGTIERDRQALRAARQEVEALTARCEALEHHAEAERAFLAASVAVWREVDRLSAQPGGYAGLDAGTALRVAERAAWDEYRAVLDGEAIGR